MKTTRAKIEFARLPKDYAGLCRILTPRPIHDKLEFQNITEITDAMAGHKLTVRILARRFGVSADVFVS